MTLEDNVKEFGIPYFGLGDKRQGIVHIIGPEQGFTLPGTTLVCSDSHTSTHGAFGALAFGIGTSEAEHVLATQTLITRRSKNMRIRVDGDLPVGVSSKDIILHIIGQIGIAGGTGSVIEYCGSTISGLSMEARMSICNMSIEAGARGGVIAPDEKTLDYIKGRPLAPKQDSPEWLEALKYWKTLYSDKDAVYDREIFIDAKDIAPTVSWGTTAECVVPITGTVPDPKAFLTKERQDAAQRMLKYMGLTAGMPMEEIYIDKVFIGSCTNSRIEDLREAARIVKGKRVSENVKLALIVPGSGLVKKQAEIEGLDRVFLDAGFEWREAGCSMCLGMNPDILLPRERCASTSNRNFEGRQGSLGRTHLMSPIMVAAAAITGKLADVRKLTHLTSPSSLQDRAVQSLGFGTESNNTVNSSGSEKQSNSIDDLSEDRTLGLKEVATASKGLPSGLIKFTIYKGIAAPLERANVDTDAIIPKQFLKTIARTGLGDGCFYDLRFNEDGFETDFVLNKEPYRTARILVVTGVNFGCGSSREHAPWALLDFGIRCIIAPSFADIFFNNSFKNGMLPITITNAADLEAIAAQARAGKEIEVDLPNQTINDEKGRPICCFEVEEFRKYCLVNGLDDIGLTMQMEDKIKLFETSQSSMSPWVDISAFSNRKNGKIEVSPVEVHINRDEERREQLEW